MPFEHFSTERLAVHHWRDSIEDGSRREDLVSKLTDILTDPVLEHLPPSFQVSGPSGGLSAWIDARAAESDVFLVSWKNPKELVGLMILVCDPDTDHGPTFHIGYLITETAWGQGVASELIAGLVSEMVVRRPVRLVGGVGKNNAASARVLVKAGFVPDPDLSDPETDTYTLALD